MINYEPFWATLRKRNITKYQLIYHWNISSNTLRRMAHNEPINTTTMNEFCLILNCRIQDIVKFEASKDELDEIKKKRDEITSKKRKSKKSETNKAL